MPNYRMKKLILILFIAILTSCNHRQNKTSDLLGNWVSVKTDGIDSSGHVILNGYLLHITENKYSYSHIFKDTIITDSYSLKNDTIYFDGSTNNEIQSITADSMKLIFRESGSIVTYHKLPYTQSSKITIDDKDLTSNSWNYILDTLRQRIEFLKNDWIYHNDDTKNLYTHPINESPYFYFANNRWRIFDFMSRTYFVRTFEQHFGLLHEVYKVSSDTIYTKAWTGSCFEYPFIVKIKPIEQSDLRERQNILSNKQWKVFDIEYKKELLQDLLKQKIETRLYNEINIWNLRFDFKPNTCQIITDDSSFNFQNWIFTKDGEYLRLDSKFENSDITNFVKIEKITKDTLIMKNRFLWSEILGLQDYGDIDIEIKLIKVTGHNSG